MIWWYVAWAVVAVVAYAALSPKPSQTNRKPPGFAEIEAPTAEEGREIPVLFGTYEIESPNVVYYGDFEAVAVKK
jgi:hypothetical protein